MVHFLEAGLQLPTWIKHPSLQHQRRRGSAITPSSAHRTLRPHWYHTRAPTQPRWQHWNLRRQQRSKPLDRALPPQPALPLSPRALGLPLRLQGPCYPQPEPARLLRHSLLHPHNPLHHRCHRRRGLPPRSRHPPTQQLCQQLLRPRRAVLARLVVYRGHLLVTRLLPQYHRSCARAHQPLALSPNQGHESWWHASVLTRGQIIKCQQRRRGAACQRQGILWALQPPENYLSSPSLRYEWNHYSLTMPAMKQRWIMSYPPGNANRTCLQTGSHCDSSQKWSIMHCGEATVHLIRKPAGSQAAVPCRAVCSSIALHVSIKGSHRSHRWRVRISVSKIEAY